MPTRVHVVGPRVRVAPQRRWRTKQKVTPTLDAESGYVLPVKESSDRNAIHDRAAGSSLILTRNRGPRHLELRRRRSVVGTKRDHGGCCGIADCYASILGIAVPGLKPASWFDRPFSDAVTQIVQGAEIYTRCRFNSYTISSHSKCGGRSSVMAE